MAYVYSHSYKSSDYVHEWISYTVPEYEVIGNTLHQKSNFASSKPLNTLIKINRKDYDIYQINLYDNNKELPYPNVDLSDVISNITWKENNNRLIFEMKKDDFNSIYTEPTKPDGWIGIYKDGKIYYQPELYYYIESDISDKLFLIEKDSLLNITLYPFKSSKYGIDLKNNLEVNIPTKINENGLIKIVNETYSLYIDIQNTTLHYIESSNYNNDDKFLVKLAEIALSTDVDKTVVTDIRQLGGGLIEEVKDDFDLLDIGHIDGRPYRKGNTLIITMPTKYEPYKNKIFGLF
jgi:hypothetical protein